ncbi:hypothetical protein [Flavivirga eckloniae]|uniref:PKD domain-containing protein n=1 Tax=Flavivirga eckloniae TaxID=1803846 RepID=A0A2K9PPU3_9FLAO|nr:hypothetical protein [Flavivirga eckloniae]AUP79064.1 hypothetical protein C1H87_10280 [Flavivirga eckloniae]
MEAYNTSIYPVFEADQVLSQKELNLLVSHLEEQDRITRKNLIGLGIVCGLELSFPTANTVKIACGTAVTSLGFQMNWKGKEFTQYRDYEISDQFLKPDYIKEPYLDAIFKYASKYEPIKKCAELLPADTSDEGKKPIPNNFFDDKLIILLLEVTLIDQKNCVTTNCDDKGKRMEFNIRPLVIPINDGIAEFIKPYQLPESYSKLSFPRYNVPYKNLITASNILDGFKKVYNDSFLTEITGAIANVYDDFKNVLAQGSGLSVLENSKGTINDTVDKYKTSVNIQYVWDWIFDIVNAYNEIIDFRKLNPSLCCVDEDLFPFHVVLGGNTGDKEAYRTPFIKTLNGSHEEDAKRKELILLFKKLVLILTSFEIPEGNNIRITPSCSGKVPLSEKAIPFYYDDILDLNKNWNPELTSKNQNDTILSYHSNTANYTNIPSVKEPLLYDTEPYNFFRVEGHIGMNYKKAIENLNLIKNSYGLPFKVTALNAVSFLNKEVDISKFQGRWDDLETDYDLARKRVYNITEFVIKWMDLRRNVLDEKNIISKQNIDNFKNILAQLKNLLTNDLKEFLPNYKSFYDIFKQLNYVFLFHRWCIQLQNPTLSTIAEDLIDRMDDINELFLEDPFTVIYEEANLRWQQTYKDLFFSTFLQKHPGLEHKAGVTKGGTFVMVYVDTSIFKAAAPPSKYANLLNAVLQYKDNIPIEAKVKDDLIKSVQFEDYKSQTKTKPKGDSVNKCKDESDNIKSDLLEIAKYNLDTSHTVQMNAYFLENLKGFLQFDVGTGSEKSPFQQTIIADFYLPYVCCGDGNNLEVKIEVNEPLSIALEELKYCQTDVGEYEVKVKGKSGGNFTGTAKDAIVQKSDKYYLKPNHTSISAPKIYTLQYEIDGELSNTIEFEIVSPKSVKWTAAKDEQDPNKFSFRNTITPDAHEYEFDFGDDSAVEVTKENTISHTFNFNEVNKQFTVTIKQLGEVCENTQTITVKASTGGDFNNPDFNATDFNTNQ